MKYLLFLLSIILFTFQGCSTKQATPYLENPQVNAPKTTAVSSQNSINNDQKTEEDIEDFEAEFEAEERSDISDPLSTYNRTMTSFNDKVIIYALNPVSEAYSYVVPRPFRLGVSNFIHNINFPIRLVNNLLQLKFQNSSDEIERFIINTTVGLGGLMDPAKNHMKTPILPHNEDFGQTLGHYGIGSGFHIVLPFFGPSNVRDTIGITVDGYLSPLVNVRGLEYYKIPDNLGQSIAIVTLHFINKNSLHLGEYESLKKDAIDLYPFLRDIYEQKRISDIAE
ncbi:MAG: ABC transporter [Epsilonproteobacteria bacterium 4484_65]|nr:MAG: ABC transporter [Epsilonproteobacteria bacterium 4484_65]